MNWRAFFAYWTGMVITALVSYTLLFGVDSLGMMSILGLYIAATTISIFLVFLLLPRLVTHPGWIIPYAALPVVILFLGSVCMSLIFCLSSSSPLSVKAFYEGQAFYLLFTTVPALIGNIFIMLFIRRKLWHLPS